MAKPKAFTIGPGEADYPWLTTPDTKYNKDGQYKTGLVLSGAAAQKAKQLVDDATEIAFAEKTANLSPQEAASCERYYPYEVDKDSEGNPTGYIKFLSKQNAKINLKEKDPKTGKMFIEMKPRIYDSEDKLVKGPLDIWSGSTLKLIVSPRAILLNPPPMPKGLPHAAGVQLSLMSVQIIKLKTGGTSGEGGFGKADGGWTAPTEDDGGDAEAGDQPEGQALDQETPF